MIIVNHFQNGVKIPDLLVNVVISLLEQTAWMGILTKPLGFLSLKKGD